MAIKQNVRCDKTGVVFDVSTKRIYVKDIKKLTNAQIEVLECGDYVVKKTGFQKHTYKVSYKEEKQGICLTYTDASTSETVSYDYDDGVWTFNSQDITNLGDGTSGGSNVVANPTLSGTEEDLTGLEVDGIKYKVPKGSSGGGSGSPYVVSYFDILDIVKGKSIDVATLISILEEKIPNFDTLEVSSQYDFATTEQVYTSNVIEFIKLIIDSDNHIEIYVNGDFLATESTTSNIKQVLTLNTSNIENVAFNTFSNLEKTYIGASYFGSYGNETPITIEELKTIFK